MWRAFLLHSLSSLGHGDDLSVLWLNGHISKAPSCAYLGLQRQFGNWYDFPGKQLPGPFNFPDKIVRIEVRIDLHHLMCPEIDFWTFYSSGCYKKKHNVNLVNNSLVFSYLHTNWWHSNLEHIHRLHAYATFRSVHSTLFNPLGFKSNPYSRIFKSMLLNAFVILKILSI